MDRPHNPAILVIDDDPSCQDIIQHMLTGQYDDVVCVAGPDELSDGRCPHCPSVIFLDWQLASRDGTALIEPLRRRYPLSPIIFVTAHSSPEIATASIKLGVFDFLSKPLDESRLLLATAKAVEQHQLLVALHRFEEVVESGFEGMVGTSPQMQTVYSTMRNVAPTNVNVMISGESGTGKELVALAIHQQSKRAKGPFVALNMASIPDDLVDATLFGHEKGAFTGAEKQRAGAVREAAAGTLFLDEITEMPLSLQGKLLRFLQERVFRPIGGDQDVSTDTRIVSATNCDPAMAVREQRLRADVYYRLNVIPIHLPPLRERDGDIPLLVSYGVRQLSKKHGKRFQNVHTSALDAMMRYSWPGNVRELMHVLECTIVLHHGDVIEPHMLPSEIVRSGSSHFFSNGNAGWTNGSGDCSSENQRMPSRDAVAMMQEGHVPVTGPFDCHEVPDRTNPIQWTVKLAREDQLLGEVGAQTETATLPPETAASNLAGRTLEQLEKQAIRDTLVATAGNKAEAARRLGISEKGFYNKIKRFGITCGDRLPRHFD